MADPARGRTIQFGILCGMAIWHPVPVTAADKTEVAVLVDNIGRARPFTLAQAHSHATHVLRQADVTIRWLECSFAEAELRDPPGCQLPLDVATIIVKILSKAQAERWIMPPKALGFSQDANIFILLPRVELLAAQEGVAESVILGHAMAHEIGHALLGPGHSAGGLMRNWLRIKELRLAEKGQLQFSPKEALRIRQRIRTLSKARVNSPNETFTGSRATVRAPSTSR